MYTKHTGIILKKHPLGEADEMLTVFTKDDGKLRFKSRSTRKVKSRLAGALQTLNEIEFEIARSTRSGQAGRGNMPVVISVRISKLNNYLREDLRKFAVAQVGAETLYRISPDGVQNEVAYKLLRAFLDEEIGLREFQLMILKTHGYENPELSADKDKEIDRFLEYVLERQVRSNDFMKSVSN